MKKLIIGGLVALLSGCATPQYKPKSFCESQAEEDKKHPHMGWSVYGQNVSARCLSDHIGKYMLVNGELGIPYSWMGPRQGRRVSHEIVPVFNDEDRAATGGAFILWREHRRGQFEYDWKPVEVTPGTIRKYVTNVVVPSEFIWSRKLEETKKLNSLSSLN
tara:strand:+ start:235 stop:717 length:483 start_codon:yes stop_codon:yes gene_type:complete